MSEMLYQPKSRHELIDICNKIIEKEGHKADLNVIDTSNITDMSGVFKHSKFNGDISEWDTSSVTDMAHMFASSEFNGDISKWNTSKHLIWKRCF